MKNNETINILFCGIGGQGVLKASELCCLAALFDGYHVKKSEVHGMAQRGGSVESHVRFGKLVYSPLIPCGMVDYLLPLHRDEHERLKHFLKHGGIDLLQWLEKAETADKKYLNTYMVGVLSRFLPIKENSWLRALEVAFSHKKYDYNKHLFLRARREVQL
ncbi:2-oxoacid:acceptor oxidoreductase family protein [Candidatus Sumerlaeota bacterium]|nr:2-oxoacid:acceptor oxidoreductase family protein [Candidatus Sumerlaeota bacterium]